MKDGFVGADSQRHRVGGARSESAFDVAPNLEQALGLDPEPRACQGEPHFPLPRIEECQPELLFLLGAGAMRPLGGPVERSEELTVDGGKAMSWWRATHDPRRHRKATTMKTTLCISLLVITASGCSSLDPSVGKLYEPTEDGGAEDAGNADNDVDDDSAVDPGGVSFARDIRPIIMRTRDEATATGKPRGCVPCHLRSAMGVGASLAGFDVSTLGNIRKGGGSSGTRIIVAGKPAESVIVQVLRGQYFYANKMPKGGPTALYWAEDSEEMQLLTTWIRDGAHGAPDE